MQFNLTHTSKVLEHPSVKQVLEIAEEIIDQNKALNAELLYNVAKKRLGMSRRGLSSIIQTLLNRKILVEGSKYTRDTVMQNRFRRKLYEFIRKNLGTHFSLIKNQLLFNEEGKTTSPGRLIWHLEMLLKFNFIKRVKLKNFTLFLPLEVSEEEGITHFILRDEINYKILAMVFKSESIKAADIHKVINEKREVVYYRVKNLIEIGFLSFKEQNREKIIINPKIYNLITNIFSMI
jgi:predicted transcriptional regulator